MKGSDFPRLAVRVLLRHPLRSSLMLVAMSIGVSSVILLTSLGESARAYISNEFATLGTHLIMVSPGRTETSGVGPGTYSGDTPRDLTIADAMALHQSPLVTDVAPMVAGKIEVSWGGRSREAPLIGATAALLKIRHWTVAQGRFLPPRRSRARQRPLRHRGRTPSGTLRARAGPGRVAQSRGSPLPGDGHSR